MLVDTVKTSELKIGDIIDTSFGYTLEVLGIKKEERKWQSDVYHLTVVNNIDDSRKPYERVFYANSVQVVILDFNGEGLQWAK